ncbi:MAG: hypothetical protein ACREQI_16630 [Candidatus Binataceae bacterium]
MRGASTLRHRPIGPSRAHRGPAKIIELPSTKNARRRRILKAGAGLLLLSILSAILARLYQISRSAAPASGKVSQPAESTPRPRAANAH